MLSVAEVVIVHACSCVTLFMGLAAAVQRRAQKPSVPVHELLLADHAADDGCRRRRYARIFADTRPELAVVVPVLLLFDGSGGLWFRGSNIINT